MKKIVIEIDEADREDIGNIHFVREDLKFKIGKAIMNGTPLEKIKAEIEPKCDRINSLVSVLPYTAHREIQELLCEIMDLKAFQIGMALGFCEKHDEMDKVIDEIKKAVKPQEKTKRCKECKYSEYCRRWGNKYKTEEDDYCFMFEPQESEG